MPDPAFDELYTTPYRRKPPVSLFFQHFLKLLLNFFLPLQSKHLEQALTV